MINIAICDDEIEYILKIREVVEQFLKYKKVEFNITQYLSGNEFINNKTELLNYDVVFLDINMDEIDGIEIAKIMREYSDKVYIIFVTAFINYTLEGYKVDATRYILKNYDSMDGEIEEALDTVLKKMKVVNQSHEYDFIGVGQICVNLNSIVYIESNLHKVTFHLINANTEIEYERYDKLSQISEDYDSELLVRVHQSFLVNLKYVKSVKRYEVVLESGEIIPVSKRWYADVHSKFVKYCISI